MIISKNKNLQWNEYRSEQPRILLPKLLNLSGQTVSKKILKKIFFFFLCKSSPLMIPAITWKSWIEQTLSFIFWGCYPTIFGFPFQMIFKIYNYIFQLIHLWKSLFKMLPYQNPLNFKLTLIAKWSTAS